MKDDILLNEHVDVNLTVPDPKSQRDIDKMSLKDGKRFNDATIAEVNGMKRKGVMELRTLDSLPEYSEMYQSVVNWTSKRIWVYTSKPSVVSALEVIGVTRVHRIRSLPLSTFARF
jgi:hypothetical protein